MRIALVAIAVLLAITVAKANLLPLLQVEQGGASTGGGGGGGSASALILLIP